MQKRSLALWTIGLGLAWAISGVLLSVWGALVGGIVGGGIAALGIRFGGGDEGDTGRPWPFDIGPWILAITIGQIVFRIVGEAFSFGGLADLVWIISAVLSSGMAGALGALTSTFSSTYSRRPSLSHVAKWSFAMALGGLLAITTAWLYRPLVIGFLGLSLTPKADLAIGLFAAGAVNGLISAGIMFHHPNG